jgi:hypothetical protein
VLLQGSIVAGCTVVPTLSVTAPQRSVRKTVTPASRNVRNVEGAGWPNTSEYGLSSETWGRLNEGITPSHCKVAIMVQRFSITSSKSFGEIVKAIDAAISHPDVRVFLKSVESAKSFAEIEALVHNAIGASDFMEFIRFDLGEVLRKDHGKQAPRSLRLVIGNPLQVVP